MFLFYCSAIVYDDDDDDDDKSFRQFTEENRKESFFFRYLMTLKSTKSKIDSEYSRVSFP